MKKARLLTGSCLTAAALLGIGWLVSGCATDKSTKNPYQDTVDAQTPVSFLYRTNFHGWDNSILIGNGLVEAVIVPQVGRVMDFRFAGEKSGPLWINSKLLGKTADPASTNRQNFGGDKVWPSPRSSWGIYTPTNDPPPAAYDSTPVEAIVDGWVVTLKYPEDPGYGIQVTRRIELLNGQPVMEITTKFTKTSMLTLYAGVWSLTQLKDPQAIYARVPDTAFFPQSFRALSPKRPPSLRIQKQILTLKRDPKDSHRVGLALGSLLWMDENTVLEVSSPRLPFRDYPEEGVSAAIATLGDPDGYVEFELMSPLKQLRIGDVVAQRTTFTLLHRKELDPDLEAAHLLPRY